MTRGRESNRRESFKSGKVVTFSQQEDGKKLQQEGAKRADRGSNRLQQGCSRYRCNSCNRNRCRYSFRSAAGAAIFQKHLAPIIFVF